MKNSSSARALSCTQCGAKYPKGSLVCPKDGSLLVPYSESSDSLLGKVIDQKYKVLEKLGGGGMGLVYKAEHVLMSRVVAIKVLHQHLAESSADGEFLKRFHREARMAAQMEHPNAVRIYDFGVWEKQPYIVMQYIRGENLKSVLNKEKKLEAARAVDLLSQVCDAVSMAHRLQFIHRDLKPENIMIIRDEDGQERAQVLDFGLAKVMSEIETNTEAMTKTGIVLGTPFYMAPEQAIASSLDARTEVYSLGIILYEMLAGFVPFRADSAMEIMLKHIREKPEPLTRLVEEGRISAAMEKVVMKSLKKEPKNRFQTVKEFAVAMDEALTSDSNPRQVKQAPTPDLSVSTEGQKEVEQSEEKLVRRWGIGAMACVLLIGASMGFAINPAYEYLSLGLSVRKEVSAKKEREAAQHLNAAQEFVSQGNMKAAIYEYNKALELTPSNVNIYIQLGKHYADALKYDQAVIVLEKAVDVEDKNEEARIALGNVYLRQGETELAEKQFRRALEINPKNKVAKKNLSQIDNTGH